MKILTFITSLDRNEVAYWLGLIMLFAGLAIVYSFGMALWVSGFAMMAESIVTSYIAAWVNKVKN